MERRSEKLTEALPYIKVSILFRIIEMYCPKNIWIYWEILIFILDEQYRTELGYNKSINERQYMILNYYKNDRFSTYSKYSKLFTYNQKRSYTFDS